MCVQVKNTCFLVQITFFKNKTAFPAIENILVVKNSIQLSKSLCSKHTLWKRQLLSFRHFDAPKCTRCMGFTVLRLYMIPLWLSQFYQKYICREMRQKFISWDSPQALYLLAWCHSRSQPLYLSLSLSTPTRRAKCNYCRMLYKQ